MKNIFVIILSLYFSASFGQISIISDNQDAADYFNLGVKALNKNEIRKADSLFTKSLLIRPSKDALFNRALTRFILKDSCTACLDLSNASELYSDKEASELHTKYCMRKHDTLFFDKEHRKISNKVGYKYYEEIITPKFISGTYGIIHKKNHFSSTKINADLSKKFEQVDIYATYVIIDSIKYYDFIYSSTFEVDNNDNIEEFKERLTKYLDSKYSFDSIPHIRRYCSAIILINSEGLIVKSTLKSNPFNYFDKKTRTNIESDIDNSIQQMPQLKPVKLFGEFVNIRYNLIFGI